MDWNIKRAENGLKGEILVQSDKSISHRAIMFSAISKGKCTISNFLSAEDCMSTLEACRSLGISIKKKGDTVIVEGNGLRGLTPPDGPLYLGNSGTTMRVISGILAGQKFSTTLTGDDSLSSRPMGRVIDPLTRMGAEIKSRDNTGCAPLTIKGSKGPLTAIHYNSPVASAQVKSCVLSAGLYAEGKTSVTEPFQSRDHTERMLKHFSADIERDGLTTTVSGVNDLYPKDLFVPGDISSAAFFIVAGLIVKGSRLILRNVGLNPTRTGIIDVLKRMGAVINILEYKEDLEPVGDLEVSYSELKSTVVEENEIPFLIDEVPILAVAAALADGTTTIKGIKELKVKETDRVKCIIDNFTLMGAYAHEENNTLFINGSNEKLKGATCDSFGDHRIAMSMAIAALVSDSSCSIANTECVNTSYPGFFQELRKTMDYRP